MATLKLTLYLWRDDLPAGADCWDYGSVYIPADERKLRGRGRGTLFNRPEDFAKALHKELRAAGLNAASLKEK